MYSSSQITAICQSRRYKNIIKNGKKENVKQVIEFVREHKGIDYAIETARGYSDKAREALKALPDSQSKLALEALVDFVIERKN